MTESSPRRSRVFAGTLAIALIGCGAPPGPLVACPDAGTALTYANFGSEFMHTYCVACHSGTRIEKKVDLSTAAGVATNATKVITTAGTGMSMPEADPLPTAEQRAQLAEWASCGAP